MYLVLITSTGLDATAAMNPAIAEAPKWVVILSLSKPKFLIKMDLKVSYVASSQALTIVALITLTINPFKKPLTPVASIVCLPQSINPLKKKI